MKLRIIVIKNNNNIFKKSANIIFTSKNKSYKQINKNINQDRLTHSIYIIKFFTLLPLLSIELRITREDYKA